MTSEQVRQDIDAAVAGATVCTMFQNTVAAHPDVEALRWKVGEEWQAASWKDYGQQVGELARGLLELGLGAGEFVAILASNRPEYYVADIAILHCGGVPVSIYNTLSPDQIEYIVNHCGATYFLAENPAVLARLQGIRAQLTGVRKVILMEGAEMVAEDPWVISLDSVIEAGRKSSRAEELESRSKAVRPEDLATLIYTSGTTGPPKGVMITHRNVAWTAESLNRIMTRPPGMRHISYLPLAHIAERMAGHYMQIKSASTCSFCPTPQQIGDYLKDVRPQFFFAVPRIWEKLHAGLNTAIQTALDEGMRAMVQGALDVCLDKVRREQRGESVPEDLAAAAENAGMITAMIRSRAGLDAIEIASAGAAPIAPELLEWFYALGVPIAEVYGQSEGSGPTSWNPPQAIRIGTVGPAIPGVELRLEADGELLVRGGNVSAGYYKEPVQTAETFDADGWLHSGDVAVIDDAGYVKIVDRKKEIIITAGGKNIAPSNLENLLKQKPLIGQACVIGDKRPFVSALIVLDPETAIPWARQQDLPTALTELANHPDVFAVVQGYVDEVNRQLSNVEAIKKFVVLASEWTVDSGELTPTMKMKRKVVNQRYEDAIEAMYRN